MTTQIDGIAFKNMVDYAVRNLNRHCRTINRLNVFPVPDGDTGTNMVTTIHRGLQAVGESPDDLPSVSRCFARAVVFEARGNSGVIVSQFLKGLSEGLYHADCIDAQVLIGGLENGVQCAYSAVANPVEGTMLTVLREATAAVKKQFTPEQTVQSIISAFIRHAKVSLEHTPELLPVLKENGVVDSGGAGIVCLFEGMQMYLNGETLEPAPADTAPEVDYDSFHPDSSFPYGYCTELLLQLLNSREAFVRKDFQNQLSQLGDSIVLSQQDDKVRIHIHTRTPEHVFSLCHRYGEFLTMKIENMTVQHTELAQKILCASAKNNSSFAVVAVAYDSSVQKLFVEMGADIAIFSPDGMSTKDYLEAFEKTDKAHILVYPNGSDAMLCAIQAKKLYKKAAVTVVNSRSIAECYASLPTIDFSQNDVSHTADCIAAVISNLYMVSVAKPNDTIHHGGKSIGSNEYYSFSGKELIAINRSLTETVVQTVQTVLSQQNKEIITIFHPRSIRPRQLEEITVAIEQCGIFAEVFTVAVDSLPCALSISFE